MYNDKVVDYFMNPRNVGSIDGANGVGEVGNPKCGDVMKVYLDIDGNDVIRDVKFETFGCAAAIATSSMATELVKGLTVDEAMKLTNKDVANELGGLPPQKLHCSLLAEEALHAAIADYKNRKSGASCAEYCNACVPDDEEDSYVPENSRVSD
ncbi:iron-sulfur cluster assembly scaffold protein NifU [Synergistales bacterium]|nr:iron-sulfur cluster assembly scaffold protein NifU [Synergistales bacterium]GHV54983.1 iron-sulfur cluster assembly scaffold protein NifU [Synergistales bacterium]